MSVDGGGGERWGYKYILMRISVEVNGWLVHEDKAHVAQCLSTRTDYYSIGKE